MADDELQELDFKILELEDKRREMEAKIKQQMDYLMNFEPSYHDAVQETTDFLHKVRMTRADARLVVMQKRLVEATLRRNAVVAMLNKFCDVSGVLKEVPEWAEVIPPTTGTGTGVVIPPTPPPKTPPPKVPSPVPELPDKLPTPPVIKTPEITVPTFEQVKISKPPSVDENVLLQPQEAPVGEMVIEVKNEGVKRPEDCVFPDRSWGIPQFANLSPAPSFRLHPDKPKLDKYQPLWDHQTARIISNRRWNAIELMKQKMCPVYKMHEKIRYDQQSYPYATGDDYYDKQTYIYRRYKSLFEQNQKCDNTQRRRAIAELLKHPRKHDILDAHVAKHRKWCDEEPKRA